MLVPVMNVWEMRMLVGHHSMFMPMNMRFLGVPHKRDLMRVLVVLVM